MKGFLNSRRFSRAVIGFAAGLWVGVAVIFLGLILSPASAFWAGFFIFYYSPVIFLASIVSCIYLGYKWGKSIDLAVMQTGKKPVRSFKMVIKTIMIGATIFLGVLVIPFLLWVVISIFKNFPAKNNYPLPQQPVQGNQVCIQVITPAKNPQTGECREFPNPCVVPQGWQKLEAGQACQ